MFAASHSFRKTSRPGIAAGPFQWESYPRSHLHLPETQTLFGGKMNPSLSQQIKKEAQNLGFDLVGIAPATEAPHWDRLCEWVERGFHAGMEYIPRRLSAYRHPSGVLPGCRSLVMVAASYPPVPLANIPPGVGRIAAYATRTDYHTVLREKLRLLAHFIEALIPGTQTRPAVDTAPLMERSFGWLAGLGWIGKNTMLLHPRVGSYILLGAVLTTAELPPDPPFPKNYCGRCQACLEVCPTGALVAPFTLDARRCISYWTIEAKSLPPGHLRPFFDQWFFGCDLCQQVCPWNRRILYSGAVPGTRSPLVVEARQLPPHIAMCEVLRASDSILRQWFRDTPLWRAKPAGLRRNAAIVLGNCLRKEMCSHVTICSDAVSRSDIGPSNISSRSVTPNGQQTSSSIRPPRDFPESAVQPLSSRADDWQEVLTSALQDPNPCVRRAAAWALAGRPTATVRSTLHEVLARETDPDVRQEISALLSEISPASTSSGEAPYPKALD